MKILHLEASPGWGGQEIRSLREAEGLRARGHDILFGLQVGGGLVAPARAAGFAVAEFTFSWRNGIPLLAQLIHYIKQQRVDLVVTHSSLDAWIGGLAARCCRVPIVRIRHLSTPIAKGLNSLLLYRALADRVITTCAEIVPLLQKQAALSVTRCVSIPTGVQDQVVDPVRIQQFREQYGIASNDIVIGTACVLRGWKGIEQFIQAAHLLRDKPGIRWLIVGDGPSSSYFHKLVSDYQLGSKVVFTGHLDSPIEAMGSMDIFCLLSYAHEGVSQAVLQAAFLGKPLVTTPTGGLKEICIDGVTGRLVRAKDPFAVAHAVVGLLDSPSARMQFGEQARAWVQAHFTYERMLERLETMYQDCLPQLKKSDIF